MKSFNVLELVRMNPAFLISSMTKNKFANQNKDERTSP
jgi:hypothetical protein